MMLPFYRRPDMVRFASAGLEFALTFGMMLAAGFWLDRRLDTLPGFMLLGGTIGFAAALYRLLRQARQARQAGRHDPRAHRQAGQDRPSGGREADP